MHILPPAAPPDPPDDEHAWKLPDGVSPELFERAHAVVKRVVRARLRSEAPGHSIRTTALTNDVLYQLRDRKDVPWNDEARLRSLVATVILNELVDRARRRNAAKRGGDRLQVPLDDATPDADGGIDALVLGDLFTQLAARHPRQARVAGLRIFGDMTNRDIARVIDVSPRTVQNDWLCARAWIRSHYPQR